MPVVAVLAVGAGCFFLSLHWSLFFGRKYREKTVQQMMQAITFNPLPHLLNRKDSPASAALAAGAGRYFLPFPIHSLYHSKDKNDVSRDLSVSPIKKTHQT